ncbi:hypothetical protein OL599_01320 [Rhodovastum sp. RN2-1]|uniref:Uncharacterized protein n=1 Tax=Limobrevibacterium gyesilva TaxID=2991712 RepID=A0AA42CFP3_9PROT|nr:hypothetical protein [Limobrevibacterium gyesilva]
MAANPEKNESSGLFMPKSGFALSLIRDGAKPMINVLDEQEHYVLVSDGEHFAVVERRVGKFYALHHRECHGYLLDDPDLVNLVKKTGVRREREARAILVRVAMEWRDLFEHIR